MLIGLVRFHPFQEVCQMLFDTENEDVAMERQPIPVMGRTGKVPEGIGRAVPSSARDLAWSPGT